MEKRNNEVPDTLLIKVITPENGETTMALRAFQTTFLIAIDEEEARESGQREHSEPVTIEELKQYLAKALIVDVNTDEHGNQIGFQSVEVQIDDLTELEPQTVHELYGTK